MSLFSKLANILFDEEDETEEIPTLTKKEEKVKKKEDIKDKRDDEEIIVTKVEAKKEPLEDTIEITKPIVEEKDIETKKFTFPFMDDDEDEELEEEMPKRSVLKTKEDYSYANTLPKEDSQPKKHEFLSTKNKIAKSDAYTANRNNIYDPTNNNGDHKPFTLSPIISPVYGILNENYTKDDIVEKNSRDKNSEKIDFDTVRRKAYGTLEDEIEVSLTRVQDEDDTLEENNEMTVENLKEDGISIDELLIGEEDDEKTEELFDIDEINDITENVDEEEKKTEAEIEDEKEESEDDKSDDLFDLIDSIYAGKGE